MSELIQDMIWGGTFPIQTCSVLVIRTFARLWATLFASLKTWLKEILEKAWDRTTISCISNSKYDNSGDAVFMALTTFKQSNSTIN